MNLKYEQQNEAKDLRTKQIRLLSNCAFMKPNIAFKFYWIRGIRTFFSKNFS